MITLKESLIVVISSLILGFALGVFKAEFSILTIVYYFVLVFAILTINVLAKKLTAFCLDSEIEVDFWKIQKYWFKPSYYFKKPVYAGAILPFIISVITLGRLTWMASLIFEVKPKIYRAAKRHGLYSFSEVTEEHIGTIAASGIFLNLIFSVVGYFLGFGEFSKLSVFYIFFNMLPISDLDGNKIFFGNIVLWYFLAAITLIGLFYAFFLV